MAEPNTLTNQLVTKLKPTHKAYDIRDKTVKGFLVRVYPSGTKTYRCEYKRGKHKTLGRADILTATQAREQARKIIGEVAKGIDPKEEEKRKKAQALKAANKLTLQRFIENEYEPWYKTAHPDNWQDAIKDIKRNFLKDLGDIPLEDIKQADIERWRIKRSKATRIRQRNGQKTEELISANTINGNIRKLSTLLNKAVELGYLEQNPIRKLSKLKVKKDTRIRFLNQNEYTRLIKALNEREEKIKQGRNNANAWRKTRGYSLLPDLQSLDFVDHLKPMVLISLGSGIRFGSLVRLKWHRHINFSKNNIVIQLTPDIVKTGLGYELPLDIFTSNIIRAWYKQTENQHHGKGWVFPGKNPKKHITSVKKSWRTLLQSANIEDFRWHDQRHDYASQLVMNGTDLYTVMELLGHTDPKMTKRYAHLADEHKLNAVEKLGKKRNKLRK